MLRRCAILALALFPHSAVAQPWVDAYGAGDFGRAAHLLQPVVIDQAMDVSLGDPEPARLLALLYAEGRGVPRDAIAACSLARAAEIATQMSAARYARQPADYEAALAESQAFVHRHCESLPERERVAADQSIGCFAFGMPESVLPLGGHMVRLGRAGIALADAPAETLMGCPLLVARARSLTLSPPADAAPGIQPRHFIELLAWRGGRPARDGGLLSDAAPVYTLSWVLYELRGDTLELAFMTDFLSSDAWPASALPADFDDRFELQMIRSGHIRWRFEAAPPQHGWIMLPEKSTR